MLRRTFLAALPLVAQAASAAEKAENTFPEIESKLRPIADKLKPPQPGEWLAQHSEKGQSFEQYLKDRPVRRSRELRTIYLCLIGEFSREQRGILDHAAEYLAILYDSPVEVRKKLALDDIPAAAKRKHPTRGDAQLLSTHVLDKVLKPDRPRDALAYLAFTSSDLWPGEGWNFVFGQASLQDRTGVWSIYRNGNPADSEAARQRCLKRTLHTAGHETGHILTIQHCTAFECGMNGVNHQAEADRKPLHFCPVCLRKVCWNLQVEPAAYLEKLEAFSRRHELTAEAAWYQDARTMLK